MKLLGRETDRKFGITLGILAVFAMTGAGFGIYFLVSDDGSDESQVVPPVTTATTQRATTTTQVEPPPETPIIEPPHVQLDSPAIDVAAGRYHTCALNEDGTVSCWGSNETGQIGAGLNARTSDAGRIRTGRTAVPTPTKVKILNENQDLVDLTGVAAISSGAYHTCALHTDETVSCWGRNEKAQLGHIGDCTGDRLFPGFCGDRYAGNCSTIRTSPPDFSDAFTLPYASEENCASKVLDASDNELKAVQISLYGNRSCALHADGTVSCWGSTFRYFVRTIGNYGIDYDVVPTAIPNLDDIVNISTGEMHTCGVHNDGTVSCWGEGIGGTLGDGVADSLDTTSRGETYRERRQVETPVKVMQQDNLDNPNSLVELNQVKTVHAGRLQTCAIHFDETASCWGQRNVDFEHPEDRIVLEQNRFAAEQIFVADPAGNSISSFQDIAFNDFDECKVVQQGSIFCSGENSDRGLGEWSTATDQGNFYDAEEVQKIAVGGEHTCIIYGTKSLLSCWGSNEDGQLGT